MLEIKCTVDFCHEPGHYNHGMKRTQVPTPRVENWHFEDVGNYLHVVGTAHDIPLNDNENWREGKSVVLGTVVQVTGDILETVNRHGEDPQVFLLGEPSMQLAHLGGYHEPN